MSYNTIAAMALDPDLKLRITACAASEGVASAEWWADQHVWQVVSKRELEEAYAYATGTNHPRPGYDEGVVSDAMLLASVQPIVLAQRPEGD